MKSRRTRAIVRGGIFLWLLAVGAGLYLLVDYEGTAGASGAPPPAWPSESQLARDAALPTLVLVVHPHCPCSRASVGELERLLAQTDERVNTCVVFVKPRDFGEDWEKTAIWENAARLPGARRFVDVDGVEAARFGAATSGQTLLYSAAGRLLFSGGVTLARGHIGDNPGRRAIRALLDEGASATEGTAVFGCPLFSEAPEDQQKGF